MVFELNSSMKKVSNVQPHIYRRLLRNKVSWTNGILVDDTVQCRQLKGRKVECVVFQPNHN